MNLRCACGSGRFKAPRVTLVLTGVPCEITEDGPQYDDTDADWSEGWDFTRESRVACISCGKEYDIAEDKEADIRLEPVQEGSR